MKNNSQSRKWQITINNPMEKDFSHKRIKQQFGGLKSLVYFCVSDEIGLEENTPHTHVYVAFTSPVRFGTLKNRFSGAHIEKANGTSQQNRDYIFKLGKWEHDAKHGTKVPDTQEEWGEMPVEQKGSRRDLAVLYDMIKDGMSNYEIMEESPEYMFTIDKIERARQTILEERFKDEFRKLDVTYIYGETETGKTRNVLEKYGYSSVFRVIDYAHPFDNYKGQDVIVFEEFRSSLRIQDMLNYLDGYPCELPCRYANKIACYTTVYIISNISLENQYPNVQEMEKVTWRSFLRRIHKVKHYTSLDIEKYASVKDYFNRFEVIQENLGVFSAK